ncbi:MAG: acyl transferase [Bacteroidota bacterium]
MDKTNSSAFDPNHFIEQLFEGKKSFEDMADELWAYQKAHNPIMSEFVQKLGWKGQVSLPIEFFKAFPFKTGEFEAEAIFQSSGTSGQSPSQHFVKDLNLYERNVIQGFKEAFAYQPYKILALLPSYLERNNSSLVHMVKTWIDDFGLPSSGFYLYNFEELKKAIVEGREAGEPMILIGVSFALLDFAEQHPIQLPEDTLVIETGGMKGKKKELVREELHALLKKGLGVEHIYSEYGMTEMMSQAYLGKNGRFIPSSTLKVWTSDFHLQTIPSKLGVSGRLHLIDLANVHSCAFIATDDIGRVYEDGSFEVLGRIDTSEMRGCNLMYV